MVEESVHCVVTSCEKPVRWRRVLHITLPEADEGLIAEVSVYLCDEHHQAHGELDDVEPFPPGREDQE